MTNGSNPVANDLSIIVAHARAPHLERLKGILTHLLHYLVHLVLASRAGQSTREFTMKVHSFLLAAYLVALVAFAASQGVNNGGSSGNYNLGELRISVSGRPVPAS